MASNAMNIQEYRNANKKEAFEENLSKYLITYLDQIPDNDKFDYNIKKIEMNLVLTGGKLKA